MQRVLFSVSYAGLWGQDRLGLEEFIPHAKALGYDAVELMGKRPHLSPLDYHDRELAGLKKLCDAGGLAVACVAAYTDFTGGAGTPEVPFVEMQVQYVEALARMARALGSGLVRVFTSYDRDDLPIAQQWSRTADAIRQCCDRSKEFGVTVGIQNHHDLAVHSRALLELHREIDRPNCKLMSDPWSVCLRGENPFEAAKALAPLTAYTTVADYVRLPRFQYRPGLTNYTRLDDMVRAVPVGEGDLDILGFLRGLKAGGYDGPVAYEMCSPLRGGGSLENLDRCAKGFLRWLEANRLT